jgi:glycosyltransferase involved in cell wall biosynthesis
MEKLTAIIPTFNESHNIDEVLKSVDFADEIMIVDSFSTDDTIEKAKKHTNFIIQREYGYSASQKNWAIPQANNQWILLVDADERVTPELKNEIIELLKSPSINDYDGYWIYRLNEFMGQKIKFGGFRNDRVIRLFKRDTCRYEDKQVHAEITTKGKIGKLKNKLTHNTYISFDHHIEKLNRYAWYQANDFNKSTGVLTPYHFVIKPAWRFFKHYIVQGGFRDGFVGLTLAFFQYYAVFTRYVKIWLLRKNMK